MADGNGTCMSQFTFLLRLILRLKAWKMLFWILLIPVFGLNFMLYKDIEKPEESGVSDNGVTELTMQSALSHKAVMQASGEMNGLKKIMDGRKGNTKDWIQTCANPAECKSKFVKSAVSGSDAIYSVFNFGSKKDIALQCLNGGKSQILCPFLFHALSQTLESNGTGDRIFKNVTIAKFYDKYKSGSSAQEREDMEFSINITRPDSMCTRTTKSGKYPTEFLLKIFGHLFLLTAGYILYFTVGTLSSISNLKENGFLQLVFSSGLSVTAFWLAYWLIAAVESFLFTLLFVTSYEIQCPGFMETDAQMKLFCFLFIFFMSLSALGYLFATLLQSFFIILLLMILLQLVFSIVMLMAKMFIFQQDGSSAIMMLFIYPPFHIVEICYRYMLPPEFTNILKKATKQSKEVDTYYDMLDPMIITAPILVVMITIYLDFIVRSGNGLCLPWTYPFSANFWNPHLQKLINMVDDQPKRANIEPTTGVPAVIANDIVMSYPAGPCAAKRPPVLRGVTCTVYQGQITALIGHNGAGKTTLIRVLMGEEIPTSGLAIINGHRVTDPYQRLALRGQVSICKQVDVLSNYLTVMESMQLMLVAKGFSVDSQVNKVLDMMKRLGLAGKENVQAMDLSGGQMRKVCSIICLLGNPRLVILDEPTSGLDPVSRRNLWQILKENRTGRSIILCTQFMDEADILAERKMFLSAGKLICAGSSMFLKHAFGCCVSINVSLKAEHYTQQLLKMLRKVKLVSQNQTELLLQVTAEKPQILAEAVEALEAHPEMVSAFGVSQAQLDDIFMRLKFIDLNNIEASFKSKKLRKLGREKEANAMVDRVDFSALYNFESRAPLKTSLMTQFKALMYMNMSRQWKAKVKFCFRIIVPLLLVAAIAALGFKEISDGNKEKNAKPKPGKQEEKKEETFPKPVVLYNMNDTKVIVSVIRNVYCIFDREDPLIKADSLPAPPPVEPIGSLTDNATTAIEPTGSNTSVIMPTMAPTISRANETCQALFLGLSRHRFEKPTALVKDQKVSVTKFIESDSIKKILRRVCGKGESVLYQCIYVYASSWDPTTSNKDRSIHLGFYENPGAVKAYENAPKVFAAGAMSYSLLAGYFQAFDKTQQRNFTMASVYLAETFAHIKFSPFELIAYTAAFALIPVTYLNDPIEDKDCGVRQHLASMGMSTIAYWFNTFILHWFHYIVCTLLTSVACAVLPRYQHALFFTSMVAPVLLMGTTSSQLCVYVVSAMMKKTNAIVLVVYFFFAMLLGSVVLYFHDSNTTLMLMLFLLPQAAPVTYLIIGMKTVMYAMLFYDTEDASIISGLDDIFYSNEVLSFCIVAMPAHIILLVGIIMLIENPGALANMFIKAPPPRQGTQKKVKDEGVKLEADRINRAVKDPVNMLEVRDLQKLYPNGVHAVRGTTFGTLAGEIIGLLGPNGAGKSTSMSIIVGEEAASSGSTEVHFSGTWMSGMDGARCGAIGYCPQHNPLFNAISVYEHLRFYALIRGIPAELATAQIAGLIDGLGLKPHRDKAAEQLSGGNKRRLCLAIALLGNPSLVVIDEASTGVDPENKRFIWAAIRGMASKFRSVMITTHSMEEVEALCARVGVMNKGVMIAFGTVQQLRSRHGEAYTLDVLMKAREPNKLELKKKKLAKRIAKQFPGATVMEDLMRCMQFNLPKAKIPSFSIAMRWLIGKKRKLGIQLFSLYQMSLDQVFVKLVKEYDES